MSILMISVYINHEACQCMYIITGIILSLFNKQNLEESDNDKAS